MTQPTTTPIARPSSGATLADFFHHIRYSNPFAIDRVTEPYGSEVDVETIHAKQSDRLTSLALEACRDGRGIGAVLWGEPGVGKSHLLARFRRWADQEREDQKGSRAYYIFLHNIQASPERLPRYILKCVIASLTDSRRSNFAETDLQRLINRTVWEANKQYSPTPSKTPNAEDARKYYDQFVAAQIADDHSRAVDDRAIYHVLFTFYLIAAKSKLLRENEELAAIAVRWLAGEALDAAEAKQLRLAKDTEGADEFELPDNQAVERVLVVLMRLAKQRGQSFILCFDQVENLNQEQIVALSQFSHSLLDCAPNLLLVTSGVQQEILEFKERSWIRGAAWDRIAQEEVLLRRINPAESRLLLSSRLESFLEAFRELDEIKPHVFEDSLFPLGKGWLDKQLGPALELRPRDVIRWSRQRWNEQLELLSKQGEAQWLAKWPQDPKKTKKVGIDPEKLKELIDDKVESRIYEQVQRRELDPSTLPPDASNLAGLIEILLGQCRNTNHGYSLTQLEKPPGKKTQLPAYQLVVHERTPSNLPVKTGLTCVVSASSTSAAGSLRRVVNDSPKPENILLVTEERQPLKLAKTGADYLATLEKLKPQFQEFKLSFDEYATLDALQAIVGQARSGDLEIDFPDAESHPVSEAEVIESHHRRDRYRKHRLLAELLTEAVIVDKKTETADVVIPEVELQQFIKAQLALTLGCSTEELAQKYVHDFQKKHPQVLVVASIQKQLEATAVAMDKQGFVRATPMDKQFYLLDKHLP